ncbi:MAG: hypothetical protein RIQ78_1513, partial [Bacteroidota bacterium]
MYPVAKTGKEENIAAGEHAVAANQ